MLSPTRSSSQTLLKTVASAAVNVLQDNGTVEQKRDSTDSTDDQEPSKKKFKDDLPATTSEASSETNKNQTRSHGIKKRKVCVLFGYCGAGYFGLQRNAKDKIHRTIEDELVEAFVKVGAIPQLHADDMSKDAPHGLQ